jgi:hypothetical protein
MCEDRRRKKEGPTGDAMSKTFQFGDGNSPNGAHLDARRSRPLNQVREGQSATWTRADLYSAVLTYCKTHTKEEATDIFYHCCRAKHPDDVPNYAFGTVIGMMVQEMTDRPHESEVAHRPPVLRLPRKDNA